MKRNNELVAWLMANQDCDLINLVIGQRGSGKSQTLMECLRFLEMAGVPPGNIVHMDFDDPALRHFRSGEQVAAAILDRTESCQGVCYAFLDEVAHVMRFEKIFEALETSGRRFEICASASSRRLLSDDLCAKFKGRFRIVEYRPSTYYEWSASAKSHANVKNYLSRDAHSLRWNAALVRDVLGDRLAEASLMEGIVGHFYDTLGEVQSLRKIASAVAPGRSLSANTVETYVRRLENAFIVERASRWDLNNGVKLKTGDHFYFLDPALPYGRFGKGNDMALLRNLVWQELRSRYSEVLVGRVGLRGVDFFVREGGTCSYWQTATADDVRSDESRERLSALSQRLPEVANRFIVTYDQPPIDEEDGIRYVGLDSLAEVVRTLN